jgi:hypothetical protein
LAAKPNRIADERHRINASPEMIPQEALPEAISYANKKRPSAFTPNRLTKQALDLLARPAGFEPTTPWFAVPNWCNRL